MKKKIIIGITILSILFACCACSAKEETSSKGEELYEKYQTLIDALENGDYEGAVVEIQTLYKENNKPKEANPKDQIVVELTPENYFDYFDLVVDKHYDSFGDETEDYEIYIKSLMYDKGYIIIEEKDNPKIQIGGSSCSGSVILNTTGGFGPDIEWRNREIDEIKQEGVKVQGTIVYDLKSNHEYEVTYDTRTVDGIKLTGGSGNLALYPY